ncbi:MAG: cyclic nucleotide-binding domain-containing protein [Lentisphaerae bacterium]|nr:cyclic nucleotide-binding domain-containing protein [Lentisphaerota bacterium]
MIWFSVKQDGHNTVFLCGRKRIPRGVFGVPTYFLTDCKGDSLPMGGTNVGLTVCMDFCCNDATSKRGRGVMLLESLTEDEQVLLAQNCVALEFKKGETVVMEGDKGGSLMLVREGRVAVKKLLQNDKHKHLRDLFAGQFFGEMSCLTDSARSATVEAVTDCVILELAKDKLAELSSRYPEIGMKLYRGMAVELADRLAANNDDLRKAILWAIDGTDLL